MASIIIPSQSSSVFKQRRMTVRCTVADAAPTSMTMATRKSLYEVLRVKRNASQTEIKTAYRTLAKLYHPDATSRFMDSSIVTSVGKEGGDFIEIHDAYATLSDPDARSVYDMNLDGDSRRRRWNSISGMYNPTRRWETDQCW